MINKAPSTKTAATTTAATNSAATMTAATTTPTPGSPEADVLAFQAAFQRVEPEIRAVPLERLVPINFDVRSIVTTILGVYPELMALLDELVKLPIDVPAIQRLKDYALALGHTQARVTLSLQNSPVLAELAAEGITLRDQLFAYGQALAKRGIIPLELVGRLRTGTGYRNIAFDLVGWAEVYTDNWDKLEGKTLLTREEVEHARLLGARIVELLGLREQGPAVRDQAAVLRQQAYVLCADTYEEARQAVVFIRRKEGDADSIAPSLFAGRGGRGNQVDPSETADPPPPAATPAEAPLPAADADEVPVGYPGGSPFTRS